MDDTTDKKIAAMADAIRGVQMMLRVIFKRQQAALDALEHAIVKRDDDGIRRCLRILRKTSATMADTSAAPNEMAN